MEPGEIARKSLTICIQAISRVGQQEIASVLGTSEPTVSRWKNEDLENIIRMLSVAGLKVVNGDRVCVRRAEWALVTRIAARALSNEQSAMTLLFEEPE